MRIPSRLLTLVTFAALAAPVTVGCSGSHRRPTGPAPEYEEPELKVAVPSSPQGGSPVLGPSAPVGDAGRD